MTMDRKLAISLVLIFFAFVVSAILINGPTQSTVWSLLPPLGAIFLAFLSGRLFLSLGFAIVYGAFVLKYGESLSLVSGVVDTTVLTAKFFWSAGFNKTSLQIIGFVFFILAIVKLMTDSGGLHALVQKLKKFIHDAKSAKLMTGFMGLMIFIDDYANSMIVGSTMRNVTDKYRVSREKLAFIVDATSAPVCGVALVSTWIGYEVGLFSKMADKFSWGIDGYTVFLDAIGFRFYCFFMLMFVFINILMGVDFGPMKKTKPVKYKEVQLDQKQYSLSCSLVPLGSLLILVFTFLWYDGGGFDGGKSIFSFTDWRAVLTTSENSILILLISAGIAWGLANVTALLFAKMSFKNVGLSSLRGFRSALLPVGILILAWSLNSVSEDLKTGEFIVSVLGDKLSVVWLPLIVFLVAAMTAFATGTSWGTMAILIPTVTPVAVALGGGDYGVFVSLCLAAILDGAIMGDHCSPISDTTIMSTIATDCDLMAHVKTQLPYSVTVGAMALAFGYLPAAMGRPVGLSYLFAAAGIVTLFVVVKGFNKRRSAAWAT